MNPKFSARFACLFCPTKFSNLDTPLLTALYYSKPEKAFSTTLFRDRKHATGSNGMLLSHNNCISHEQAVVAWSISAVKIIQTHFKE